MLDRLKAIPFLIAIWLVNALFYFVHVGAVWKFGEILGSICFHIMKSRRQTIEKNIRIVAAHTHSVTPTEHLTKAIFCRNIANLTCSLKTYGMTPSELGACVDIQIDDAFKEAITNKTGAVLCLAHMGNWEILSKISSLIAPEPENFGAIYRPLDNKAADKYVVDQREKYGCKMFPKSTSVGTLSTFLREGGVLGILADQRSGKARKNNRPFFSANSARSKLPAILHKRTDAPLFSVAVYSENIGTWTVRISKISTHEINNRDIDSILQTITQSYETTFTKNLSDVFWLHRYWL